MAQKNGWQ